MDQTTSRICPWCSAEVPDTATACPKCGALVEGARALETEIPGVTEPDPSAQLPAESVIPSEDNPLAWLSAGHAAASEEPATPEALEPPTPEVALEMRKMELEAEIENAGTDLIGPNEQTIPAGAPSEEALKALDAGILDKEGPAGEPDLAVDAQPWEDPELEARLASWRAANPDKPDQA